MAGAMFGSALTASGVYLPGVIISQMELKDFHMLKVFLTASSLSAITVTLYEKAKGKPLSRRPPSPIGLLGKYDGNVLGGAMVGAGMALTGACPGTVLVQVATGVQSGRYALLGGAVGGLFYALIAKHLRRNCPPPEKNDNHHLPSKLGVNPVTATLVFEGMCISMILAVRYLAPSQSRALVAPILGGVLIGAAQLATLILTKAPVGVSTCYEDIGRWFWGLFGYDSGVPVKKSILPLTKSAAFAAGILAGSATLANTVKDLPVDDVAGLTPLRGLLGGMVMVLGARVAGGCTSGHGISGMSMLGVSSIITVMSMFASGIALAQFL